MTESIKYFVQHMDDAGITDAAREAYTDAIIALQQKEKLKNMSNCATCKNRRKDDNWCNMFDVVVRINDFCSLA